MKNIYSIIESFGRQFWVEPQKFQDFYNFKSTNSSTTSKSENLSSLRAEYSHKPEKSNKILFDRVMFFTDQKDIHLGKPFLKDFRIEGSLLPGIRKRSKLVVFKMRAKKGFRRKIGYRVTSRRIRFDNVLRIMSSQNNFNLQVLVKGSVIKSS